MAVPSGWNCRLTAGFPQSSTAVAPDDRRGRATDTTGMSTSVLIAGGGPAALEAALALHRLAGERVSTTLLAPESNLTYRPLPVLAPSAAGEAPTYPIERMATDAGFTHIRGRLESVDAAAHAVTTVT